MFVFIAEKSTTRVLVLFISGIDEGFEVGSVLVEMPFESEIVELHDGVVVQIVSTLFAQFLGGVVIPEGFDRALHFYKTRPHLLIRFSLLGVFRNTPNEDFKPFYLRRIFA